MYANHPDIARRWEKLTPKDEGLPSKLGNANASSESQETWQKGVQRLQRKPGGKRDFGMLHPSQSARHTPAGPRPNEKEAEQEGPVNFVHGSRHTELGTPRPHPGLRGRDIQKAFEGVR